MCTMSLLFLIVGYLTPFKIKNIYFHNYKNNLKRILFLFSSILFILQIIAIISFGPNYFKGYLSLSSASFSSANEFSLIMAELIGVLNGLIYL